MNSGVFSIRVDDTQSDEMKTTKDIKMSVVSVEGTHSLALDNPESNCYRYKHLLPYFAQDNYPPLSPFEHVDPGFRALGCENPRAFLNNASKVTDLTPNLGTEVLGLNLTELDGAGKDQLALEVCIGVQPQYCIDAFIVWLTHICV